MNVISDDSHIYKALSNPVIEKIDNIIVVRDDFLEGGTKMRFILPYLQKRNEKEFVYASPAFGYAQVALSACCKLLGKKAVIFTAKRKADAMRKELKDWISFSMGPSAWDELVATEGRIRKQKKEQEYRKAEMIEAIITWGISGVMLIVGAGVLGFIIYMVA